MTTAFDLGAMLSAPVNLQNAVKQIPVDMLVPYHNHQFELYTGERLDDMVESVKENGILCPIIVQPTSDGKYEILIGHNRWNAGKLAGLQTVPAVIKEGLSEEEAEMYVIESNLMQRGFDNLKITEQAAVIAMRQSKMFSQGKRNDIIRELAALDRTLSQLDTKLDSTKKVGEEYGMSRASVARLLRIDKLSDSLKEYVDSGKLAVNSAVSLSYISEKSQNDIAELLAEYSVDMKKAKLLRECADEDGNIDISDIIKIIDGKKEDVTKPKSVMIDNAVYDRFFDKSVKKEEVSDTIEKALEFYFAHRMDETI